MASLWLYAFFVIFAEQAAAHDKLLMCYYGSWATYRNSAGKFDVENINAELCTHLVYTFAGIDSSGNLISLDPYLDLPDNWGRNNFGKFNALKQTKPGLKTLLAVGGWNEGSAKYSRMAANETNRNNFINTTTKMLLTHGFDGLDLDWEYPNARDTVYGHEDVDNYLKLLKEIKTEFNKHGLLLSAAVAATEDRALLSYNIPEISKYLDIIGIMTYDFYGAWDPVTGHNSPLHRGQGDQSGTEVYSIDTAISYWLEQGCPPEKLTIGLPFYGRTFILSDINQNGVKAPSSGPGIAGDYTQTYGSIGYNEFCVKLQTQSWSIKYDDSAEVPYAVLGRNWVSFDNATSLAVKTQYALNLNLGGVMVWSIETDDFRGLCGQEYPLLHAINQALDGTYDFEQTSEPNNSNANTEHPAITSSTAATDPSVCKKEGLNPDPASCSSFYFCVANVNGVMTPFHFDCPDGLHFDVHNEYCNYPELANCSI